MLDEKLKIKMAPATGRASQGGSRATLGGLGVRGLPREAEGRDRLARPTMVWPREEKIAILGAKNAFFQSIFSCDHHHIYSSIFSQRVCDMPNIYSRRKHFAKQVAKQAGHPLQPTAKNRVWGAEPEVGCIQS